MSLGPSQSQLRCLLSNQELLGSFTSFTWSGQGFASFPARHQPTQKCSLTLYALTPTKVRCQWANRAGGNFLLWGRSWNQAGCSLQESLLTNHPPTHSSKHHFTHVDQTVFTVLIFFSISSPLALQFHGSQMTDHVIFSWATLLPGTGCALLNDNVDCSVACNWNLAEVTRCMDSARRVGCTLQDW